MEFEEMKKIWDSQNNAPLYSINETALHNHILSKKNQAYHITNISELLAIIAYTATGCFILGMNIFKQSGNLFMYILAVWMLGSALYLFISSIRRIKRSQKFDRSMRGDLAHAISVATYQVRISQLMWWNILPTGILTVLGVWGSGKSIWVALGILIFFALTSYAARWEHRIYTSRKRDLEILRDKLENEGPDNLPY